jgi:putative MFS transporter
MLGTDYVVSKAILMEFAPVRLRGRILGTLGIAWAGGYVTAYFVGFALHSDAADAWRYILVTGAAPALLILPLRLRMPESPPWLVHRGRCDEARRVIDRFLGQGVALPRAQDALVAAGSGRMRELLSPRWRVRALVGATFFTCQVIPYFALGTFVGRLMTALHASDGSLGGLVYNLFLLVGAVAGWAVVDHVPRRVFLLGTFAIAAGALLALAVWPNLSGAPVVALFAVVAFALSGSSTLCYVYLTELFPTPLRGSGVGLSIAASRIGSAVSTFLLPVVVAAYGIHAALGLCVATLVAGGLICFAFAPETRGLRLGEEAMDAARAPAAAAAAV